MDGDKSKQEVKVPILGLYKTTGHIIVYGDSNCLDNSHMEIGIMFLNLYINVKAYDQVSIKTR